MSNFYRAPCESVVTMERLMVLYQWVKKVTNEEHVGRESRSCLHSVLKYMKLSTSTVFNPPITPPASPWDWVIVSVDIYT